MKKWIIGISVVLALLVVSFFTGRHYTNKDKKTAISNIIALRDSVRHYEVEIGKLKYMVAEKNSVILSQKDAIKSEIVDKNALKKLNIKYLSELNILTAQVNILKDSIGHTGNVYIDTNTHRPSIALPFTFAEINKDYSLKGAFSNTGVMSLSLNVPLNLSVYGAVDKRGIAKAYVLTDNPVVKITEITSVKIEVPKPKRYGFGIIGGYGVSFGDKTQLSPFIGAGVFYKIW